MICLNKSELRKVNFEIFDKVRKSEIASIIIVNFLESDQVSLKTEGVCFFGKYLHSLAEVDDNGMSLMKLILEENLLTVLSESILSSPGCE